MPNSADSFQRLRGATTQGSACMNGPLDDVTFHELPSCLLKGNWQTAAPDAIALACAALYHRLEPWGKR